MTAPEMVTACPHPRCGMPVIEVLLGSKVERKLLDEERVSWQDGGRVRIIMPALDDLPPVARKFQHAGQAFGNPLFQLHDETCKAGQRRPAQKATSS